MTSETVAMQNKIIEVPNQARLNGHLERICFSCCRIETSLLLKAEMKADNDTIIKTTLVQNTRKTIKEEKGKQHL